MRVTLTLASLAMALLAACATTTATSVEQLVGRDVQALRARLGPPLTLTAGPGVLKLGYFDQTGEVDEDAVIVLGGKVAKVGEGLISNPSNGLDVELRLAPIDEAIEQLGPVQSVSVGSTSTHVHFDGWDATVVDGLVLGLRKS